MVKAIIFDYDGLLVDTDNMWFQASKILCKEYGVDIPETDRADLMRGNLSQYLIDKYALPTTQEITRPKLNAAFDKLSSKGIQSLPGALDLVKLLSKHYTLALASGTRTERLTNSLKTLGIYEYFKAVLGNDQIKNGKPSPEIFLKAAEMLHVPPKECLVFEDQPKGLTAAKTASMYCFIIPNKYLKNIDYSDADMIIDSLVLVTLKDIQKIAQ